MIDSFITKNGLELDSPKEGDIVTVLIKPPTQKAPAKVGAPLIGILGDYDRPPEHENIHNYRTNHIWQVLAVNGSHAVLKPVFGWLVKEGRPEIWVINQYRWFDASKLFEILSGGEGSAR